jgi:Phage terminase large subunit (GpA)
MAKKKPDNAKPGVVAAQKHRDAMAARSRQNYGQVAEIGLIAAVKDPKRRESCRNNLLKFLTVYFPHSTGLYPFSEDHKRVIKRLETAAKKGGRFFNLVFRGFAKTTISVNACLWVMLYGWRFLIVLIGANRSAAKDLLDAIKAELETNELLAEDFPEVVQAIRALEGKNQRCASQTSGGELTHIEWTKDRIVFPTIAGSKSSGATVVTRGITASIRGIGQRRADGRQQRPDFVICDDLQTDSSAASPVQVRKRLMTLSKSVLKLAGHNSTIACVVNGTIIEPDDLMDRLRDPNQYPGWQGETVKMVSAWSENHETLWMGEYARIRKSFDPAQPGDQERAHVEAGEFYRANRAAMDSGCVVSWEHCFDHETELSAIQHAYNFLIDDGEEVFAAECQSDPLKSDGEESQLKLADIIHKLSGLKHREVPPNAVRLTAFIDTQDESFWFVVIAWTADFTGYVIDYGAFPDPKTRDASKKRLRVTLSKLYPELKNKEARWRAGLSDLADELLARDYLDSEGRQHAITFALVDVADGDSAIPLRTWVKASKWSKVLRCSMGLGLKPADTPLGERKRTDDEIRRGLNWVEKRDKKIRGGSITYIDTNYWKTFVANRWRAGSPRPKNDSSYRPNEPGALYLWGTDPHTHSNFGSHQTSEFRTRLEHAKSGRTIDFWNLKPSRPDNEWFDGVVGNCVAADSAGGISLKDTGLKSAPIVRKRGPRKAVPI